MGANLSGTYGDVLVHDTIDTIFFAPKGSSLKAVISDILLSTVVGLSSLGILAAFIPYFAATFWIFGVCIALSIIVAIIWNASRPTLLLRFPEHTWVMEKVFPTHQRIAEGNTFPWKEVMVMEVSATDVIASWHLTLDAFGVEKGLTFSSPPSLPAVSSLTQQPAIG
ncbi:MAG: hypothetical protein HY039_01955 [Nitrospirae bacterium]|nr:hypothetical protein [Nitrospirota bacterium]